MDPAVEGQALPVDAVRAVAASPPLRLFGRQVEEEGAVRRTAAGGEAVRLRDQLRLHATAAALVGVGGIREAVAQHDRPGGQGGLDHLDQVLAAAGEHEHQFDHAIDLGRLPSQEQLAQEVGEWRAARLPGHHVGDPAHLKAMRNAFELGRLAAAVETLESDEPSGHPAAMLARRLR